MGIIISILILGLIIFIHEFGHFLVAKFFKVPIREFSIGMGPRIISKVMGDTRYSLKVFPFGGSCAMIGEDVAGSGDFIDAELVIDNGDGTISFDGVKFDKKDIEKNNFSVISPWKKFLICFAGPFMNFIVAFILAFFMVLMVGFDVPVITEVQENSAASMGNPYALKIGDIITGLMVPGDKEKISSYRDLLLFMQLNNEDIVVNKFPMVIEYKDTDGNIKETVIYPKYDPTYERAMIGISFSNIYKKPTSFLETCQYAINEFYFYINTTIKSLKLLIRGKFGVNDMSGPVGTVAVMGDAINEAKAVNVESFIYTLLMLTVLISANLGVMNLLPIPALDGGRIVFAAIEMITGKPMNKNFENTANAITMILLLGLMIYVFGNDIYKLFMG